MMYLVPSFVPHHDKHAPPALSDAILYQKTDAVINLFPSHCDLLGMFHLKQVAIKTQPSQ